MIMIGGAELLITRSDVHHKLLKSEC